MFLLVSDSLFFLELIKDKVALERQFLEITGQAVDTGTTELTGTEFLVSHCR